MLDKILPYLKWHKLFPGLAQERPGIMLFATEKLGPKPWPFLTTATRGGIGWEDVALRDVASCLDDAFKLRGKGRTPILLSENPAERQEFVQRHTGQKDLPYSGSTLQNAIYALCHMGLIEAAEGYNRGFVVRRSPLLSLRRELLTVPGQKQSMQSLVSSYFGAESDPAKREHATQFLCRTVIDKAKRANRHLYPLFTEQFAVDLSQKVIPTKKASVTTDIHGLAEALERSWDNTRQQMAQITKRRPSGRRLLPGNIVLTWQREKPSNRNSRIVYTLTRPSAT